MSVRSRIHERASRGTQTHAHISKQRRGALWMTVFAGVRTVAWILCMLVIIAHWLGAGGSFIHSFIAVSETVLFVTFISFYCNASTDAANLMAGIAALFSADSHHTAEVTRQAVTVDFQSVEGDIARLADLQPGPEAAALAADIRRKLGAAGAQGIEERLSAQLKTHCADIKEHVSAATRPVKRKVTPP